MATVLLACAPGSAHGQGARGSASEVAEAKRLSSEVVRLYREGQFDSAISLAQRALAIREKALGPTHPDVATSLNNLAGLYDTRGDYDQAELLYKRALAIWEKALGPKHPDAATFLNKFAVLFLATDDIAAKMPIMAQALDIENRKVAAALVELFRYKPFNPKAAKHADRWGKARYVAYVLPHTGDIAWADLGKAGPIEAVVDALLPTLRRAAADPEAPARALDALVMQPVRLLLGDIRRVFLSAS